MLNRFRNWWSRDQRSDTRDAEGVASGVLQRPRRDLDVSLGSKEWEDTGAQVEKIYIYPMKSGRGISFKNANCGPHGLWSSDVFDRMFMIVEYFPDRKKQRPRFVSARIYHKLVLLEADVHRDDSGSKYLTLAGPESLDMRKLKVKLPKHPKHLTFTSIFFQECAGYELGDEANDWITKYIKSYHDTAKEFKILYQPYTPGKWEENHYAKKIVDETIPQTRPDDIPLFSDGYPYMLMAQRSLDELNKRLRDRRVELQVEERRFRPNILLSNTKGPFVEDDWLYLKIGDAIFRNAKLCTRCIFTTVDPKTGEARRDREPLKTLRTFRISKDQRERSKYGPTPFLGINLAIENYDKDAKIVISKGDKVSVIKRDTR